MNGRAIVVSIHDVSPRTREEVTRILGELDGVGIGRTSLLVVPDHHHAGNITGDASFCAWLREQVAAGHEAVLHGYAHTRKRRANEGALTRMVTRHYTADEGEFFDIGHDAARELLERGREDIARAAGVTPSGFIAPAWLLSAEGEEAARELGFAYTTRLKTVKALQTGRAHRSQSLCWSVRSGWRGALSVAWNDALYGALRGNALLRVSIHPPDISHAGIWRQIRELARRGIEDRAPLTYHGFVTGSAVFCE